MEGPIMDMHCHLGPVFSFYFSEANIEQMIEDADKVGISRLCVAPHIGLTLDHVLSNKLVMDAIRRFPDRVWGMLILNPNKPEGIADEFDLYYSTAQIVGVKVHPAYHQYPLDGPAYTAIFEQVSRRGGYALVHTWETDAVNNAVQCEALLKRFPDVRFVFAHALGLREGVKKAVHLVNKYENAYIDTSGFEFTDTGIRWIADRIPQDRLLFGSDCPFHDIRGGLSRILYADLDDAMKRKILCDNYINLLRLSAKKH